MTDTPRTDEILALLPGGQTCDPQAVADELRPAIAKMEREFDEALILRAYRQAIGTVARAA